MLIEFLSSPERPEGTLSFNELRGFLFAISSSPELIAPSEWLPLVFDDQDPQYATTEQAESIIQAMMELYNDLNTQVITESLAIPDDIELLNPPINNADKKTPLGQWSSGFFQGHDWLMDLWDHYTPEELDEELGGCLMTLSFFADRKLADAYFDEIGDGSEQNIEAFAEKVLDLFEDAMAGYAHLGLLIRESIDQEETTH